MFTLDLRSPLTINEQIRGNIIELIINGVLKEDDQLPPVRELSKILVVNPNTVQKAYERLELEGYIYSVGGKGNFVSRLEGFLLQKNIAEDLEKFTKLAKKLIFMGIKQEELNSIIKEAGEKIGSN